MREKQIRRLTRGIDSGADVESSYSPSVVLGPATTVHISTTFVLLKIGRFLGPTPGLLDQKLRAEHSDLYWKGILMRREGEGQGERSRKKDKFVQRPQK